MKLKTFRRTEVTYEYIEDIWLEFCKDKTSEALKVKLIPLCNLIAGDLYVKIPAPYDNDYEEYFSAAVAAVLNCLRRRDPKDFVNQKAFYGYLKSSSWFDTRNLILTDRNSSTQETGDNNFDLNTFFTDTKLTDIRDTFDFKFVTPSIFKTYLTLTSIYSWAERVCLRRFYFDFIAEKDRAESYSPAYSEYCEGLNIPITRVKELDKISRIIFKIALMHNMNEDFSIKKFPNAKHKDKDYFDKFFLVLACLDRYPYLVELLSVLGTDKFFEILNIFGGVSINIPKISEIKRVDKEVEIYLKFTGLDQTEDIKAKAMNESGVTLGAVTAAKSKINTKLNSILKDAFTG